MPRRTRQHAAVELFPFLAVLVCVMGALIFLLLVTTRKLRANAIAKARSAPVVVATDDAPILPEVADEPASLPDVLPDDVEAEARPLMAEPGWQETPPITDAAAERDALEREWQTRVASLEKQVEDQQASLNRHQLLAQTTERRIAAIRQELLQRETELAETMGRMSATEDQIPEAARQRAQLEQQITLLRQQLKQLELQQHEAQSRYTIVPFDGKSGTTRYPILIECTSTGLRFLPEDVTLTPGDIQGFTPGYNPLLAGSVVLMDYWNRQPQTARSSPYVLLVVRPDGTLAYYIAMKLLSALKQSHGYELLTDDVELQLPPLDPQAKTTLEDTIRKVLAEREQLVRSLRPGSGGYPGGPRGSSSQRMGSPAGANSGIGGPSAQNTGGETTFSMEHLDPASSIGDRSWEDIDQFEGQEYRRARTAGREGEETTPQSSTAPPVSAPPRQPATVAGTGSETPPHSTASGQPPANRWTPSNRTPNRAGGSSEASPSNPDEDRPYPNFNQDLTRSKSKGAALPYEQLQRRKWGPHEPGASIGVEKRVEVRVDAQRIVIANSMAIPVRPEASRNEVFQQVLMALDQTAQGWGQPGPGFFWVPSLKFVISPGGNTVYERIAPLVTKSGLSNSREFTLENAGSPAPEVRQ